MEKEEETTNDSKEGEERENKKENKVGDGG